MADSSSAAKLAITRLILIPVVITLAITFLRLEGELHHWSRLLFNPAPGGGGALVGISWLPIIFGPYFAMKLAGSGHEPTSFGKSIGYAVLGIVILIAGGFVGFAPVINFPGRALVGLLIMAIAAALQFAPWRALAKTLIAYAYGARIPVAIVMYFAIQGGWGTHYDALPPGYVSTGFWSKYVEIALLPQLVMWIAYTIVLGTLVGAIYAAVAHRKKAMPAVPGSHQPAGA